LLTKRLDVAFQERMRYFANRIAQTELARAHVDQRAAEIMADDQISVVRWSMSGTHPQTDICDLFAKQDKFGLGPGCYPKGKAPKPPAHPFCRCMLQPVITKDAADARENPASEREFLRKMMKQDGISEAAKVMGGRAKLAAALINAPIDEVINIHKPKPYRLGRAGDAPDRMAGMKVLSREEKAEYADWAKSVLEVDYRARHEFKRVGFLPDRVMADADVKGMQPVTADIEISDHQLRHGRRQAKIDRGQALTVEQLASLPKEIESATWMFDTADKNLLAVFDVDRLDGVGKAAIRINHVRGGTEHNAIVTTGFLDERNLKSKRYREL
jgi:hypothetical protein